jgi:hypothetical protein
MNSEIIRNFNGDQSIVEPSESTENKRLTKAERLRQAQAEFELLQTRVMNSIGTEEDRQRTVELYREIKKLEGTN